MNIKQKLNNNKSLYWKLLLFFVFMGNYCGYGQQINVNLNKQDNEGRLSSVLKPYSVAIKGKLIYKYLEDGKTGIIKNTNIEILDQLVLKTKDGRNVYLSPDSYIKNTGNDPAFDTDYLPALSAYYDRIINTDSIKFAKVLGTTITDNSGLFLFNIILPVVPELPNNNYGLIFKGVTVNYIPFRDVGKAYIDGNGKMLWSVPQKQTVTGDIYRVLRIHINSPFYYSPANDIVITQNHLYNMGTLFGYVKTYTANLKFEAGYGTYPKNYIKPLDPVPGLIGLSYRKIKYPEIPDGEGTGKNNVLYGSQYPVLSTDESGSDGIVTFKKLIRDIPTDNYTVYDKHYFYVHSDPKKKYNFNEASGFFYYELGTSIEYGSAKSLIYSGYEYNDQAKIGNLNFTIEAMDPLNPKISGKILSKDNHTTIAGATIELLCRNAGSKGSYSHYAWNTSDNSGNFEFSDLNVSLSYDLVISKSGFINHSLEINRGAPLKMGEKSTPEIFMIPVSSVHGYIVNETGDGMDFQIRLEGGIGKAYKAYIKECSKGKVSFFPTGFDLPVPKDKIHLIIEPDNESYRSIDTVFTVSQDKVEMGTIVISKNKRRLQLFIYETDNHGVKTVLEGARVLIRNISDTLLTNKDGEIKYEFFSAGYTDNFDILVYAPNGKYYENRVLTVRIKESSEYSYYQVKLVKAAFVSGYIFVGKTPIQNVKVRWENGNTSTDLSTVTDIKGFYFLKNVPVNRPGILKASQLGSQVIGSSLPVTVPEQGLVNVNFNLKIYINMDISQLIGFPIAVDSLNESDGNVRIWGYMAGIPSNPSFATLDPGHQGIPFSSVIVIKGNSLNQNNLPYAYPQGGKVVSDLDHYEIIAYKQFPGYIRDTSNGITIEEYPQLKAQGSAVKAGGIKGGVSLYSASFQLEKMFFKTDLALKLIPKSGAEKSEFYPLNSNGEAVTENKTGFSIYGSDNKDLQFTINGFNATADAKKTRLNKDSINLPVTLHTEFIHVEPDDINLNLGYMQITQKQKKPLTGNSTIRLKLQYWDIASSSWGLCDQGFYMNSGILSMKGLNVGFSSVKVNPADIAYGVYNFKSLKFLKKIDLIAANNSLSDLFYNEALKTWQFRVYITGNGYCAKVAGLPAMDVKDYIAFEQVSLFSNGSDNYKVSESTPVVSLYNNIDYQPSGFYASMDFIRVPGIFMLGIPNCEDEHYSELVYSLKPKNKLEFSHKWFSFGFSVNGVTLDFPETSPQIINQQGFIAHGEISNDPVFKFRVDILKTALITVIKVDPLYQSYDFSGGNSLKNIEGKMFVQDKSWSLFQFSGELDPGTFNGTSGRLTFTGKGRNIELEPASTIKLSNIDNPFGNIKMTYDIPCKCLTGNLKIDQNLGAINMNGMVSSRFDQDGWYFIGGGKLTESPSLSLNAVILYGDYVLINSAEIVSRFSQYFYGSRLPAMFNDKVEGFYFGGNFLLPAPRIPKIDLNLIVLQQKFSLTYGANIGIGSDFTNFSSAYEINLELYLNGELKTNVVPGDGCLKSSIAGSIYCYSQSQYYSETGFWKVDLTDRFTLTGGIDVYNCKTHTFVAPFPLSKKLDFEIGILSGNTASTEFYIR